MGKPERAQLVPTRLRLSGAVGRGVAKHLFDQLVGGWGLANATKIVGLLVKLLKAERKRRKKLEGK
jgi:hypothetical protein